jgi:hypothetical protein
MFIALAIIIVLFAICWLTDDNSVEVHTPAVGPVTGYHKLVGYGKSNGLSAPTKHEVFIAEHGNQATCGNSPAFTMEENSKVLDRALAFPMGTLECAFYMNVPLDVEVMTVVKMTIGQEEYARNCK